LPRELDAAGTAASLGTSLRPCATINNAGHQKHLILAGPCALAALIGAASNVNGPVTMPLWSGGSYSSTLTFGA
jgi:hypothetical protein